MNIIDCLLKNAHDNPDKVVFRFILNSTQPPLTLTNKQLLEQSYAIANYLQQQNIKAGDRVILLFKSSQYFVPALFGCLLAQAIAVPVQAPNNQSVQARFAAINRNCTSAIVLTEQKVMATLARLCEQQQSMQNYPLCKIDHFFDEINDVSSTASQGVEKIQNDAVAFLQYSSGSTGDPKGVAISHSNLMHNLQLMYQAYYQHLRQEELTFVCWLPLTHDMGLVGNVFEVVYLDAELTLMPSFSFVLHPKSWLQAISQYRATVAIAPNFAFQYCCDRIKDHELAELDLSSLKVTICGSEQISEKVLLRFADKFAVCGFSATTFYPSYGLAEATLYVSSSKGLKVNQDDGVVSCGQPDVTTIIMNKNQQCAEGEVGEVYIAGDSVSRSYWQQHNENQKLSTRIIFEGETYLNTGDLGYFIKKELYIVGRKKELIIINGSNYYPTDIENSVANADALLKGQAVAAISYSDGVSEQLVIIAEMKRHAYAVDYKAIFARIHQVVLQNHQLPIANIVLLPRCRLPRTLSGKIKRVSCRHAYINHELHLLFSDYLIEKEMNAHAEIECTGM